MQLHSGLTKGLQADLLALVADGTHRPALNRVVALCHVLATAFIRSKRSAWSLASRNGLQHTDIAYDCIAELFQRDEAGAFLRLRSYFGGLPLARMEDQEALTHLRRLVFARVNHGMFRLCNEYDPGLGRILRNLKLAIHALRNFEEVEKFGELWIRPILIDPLDHLQPPGREQLQTALRGAAKQHARIPDLLAALSNCLREQCDHARSVPLMDVALAIRTLFAPESEDPAYGADVAPGLAAGDTRAIIRAACTRAKDAMGPRYVAKGKTTQGMFDHYFAVIEQGLLERFVGGNGEECSWYEGLRSYVPDLSREEYRTRYKSHME